MQRKNSLCCLPRKRTKCKQEGEVQELLKTRERAEGEGRAWYVGAVHCAMGSAGEEQSAVLSTHEVSNSCCHW